MRSFFYLPPLFLFHLSVQAQTTIYVRNSTWQDFEVEAGQYGSVSVAPQYWSVGDSVVQSWIETSGQQVLSVERSNAAVPEGDTVYYTVGLNGQTDVVELRLRLIGVTGGTQLAYSVTVNGSSEPWFDDDGFHEVQTTLAGRSAVVKFKPDNDDANMDRDIRFALHDLPVYQLEEADFQEPNVLNVMYYNIQMISFGISGMAQANDRAQLLPAQISPYQDVVCFAEAFDDVPREDHLIPAMEAAGFPYHTQILNEPGGVIPFPVNGGVIIFSRWPILQEDEIEYSECGQASQDCLASKGVKYARINKSGKMYHVFGTHMDAGSGADDIHARRTQMAELRDFIADLQIPEHEPVIFGGDFNVNPIDADMDYQAFLDTMDPIIPQHTGYWESNFNGVFGGIIDHAWGDRTHLVPTSITNEIITIRSLDPVLWDLYEFSDHRCVLGRYVYPDVQLLGGDTLICPGENLTLSVSADLAVSFQWYKDGEPLPGENAGQLALSNAQESQSGHYTCLVSYDVVYGNWPDSLNALFFPQGIDTVQARLEFDLGEIVVDEVLCQVGIEDLSKTDHSIYPNPTNGELNIRLNQAIRSAQVQIHTMDGKLLFDQMYRGPAIDIDMSGFSDGVYMAVVRTDHRTIRQRIVVR